MLNRYRQQSTEPLLHLFGCLLVGAATVHAVRDPGPLLPRGLELATIVVLSASFMLAASVMAEQLDADQFVWVGYTTVGLGLLTGTLSWAASAVQMLQSYSLNEPVYHGLTMMAGGSAAGPYVGYFYGQLRQSNAELNHRYEEMQVLNRRLSVANRVLRHNLRNNLTVISGVTNDLQERTGPDTFDDHLEMLDRRTDQLTDLSEKMGELRKVWNTNDRTTLDLVDTIDSAVADVESRYPEVTIRTAVPPSAPVTVHPKIEVAIREVMTNAAKHNDASTVTIDVELIVEDDEQVTLRVADTGDGLPTSEVELFAGTDPTASPLEHGAGLGLWLVYWTAQKSGGSLSVSNEEGAVVALTLPRGESDADPGLVRPTQTLERKQPA